MITQDRKQKILSELQSLGVHLECPSDIVRRGGAGPTDHQVIELMGTSVMVPVKDNAIRVSPFVLKHESGQQQPTLFHQNELVGTVSFPKQPRFYQKETAEGVPYWKIARLHSTDVLATTILQSCIRYGNKKTKCQFCAIGESLRNKTTIAEKTPEQLAEVALAAKELDGVKSVVMTTGTPPSDDRGAAVLTACAKSIKEATGLPIQAQCEPPDDFSWFQTMKDAGVDSLGMHLEAWDQKVRERIMPGKAQITVTEYFKAFKAAVQVFGRGEVSTYLLAGLGDTKESLLEGSRMLIDIGVYPFIVPFVPVSGTQYEFSSAPSPTFMRSVLEPVGKMLSDAGMISSELKAGCAKCAACSTLSLFEKKSSQSTAMCG